MPDDVAPKAATVTAIHGASIPSNEPNPKVIAELEGILEKARSGEITGIAAVSMHADQCVSYVIVGRAGSFSMVGALEQAKADLVEVTRSKG